MNSTPIDDISSLLSLADVLVELAEGVGESGGEDLPAVGDELERISAALRGGLLLTLIKLNGALTTEFNAAEFSPPSPN